MSNEASTWAISQRPPSMAEKMVLLAYANCASPTGIGFASVSYVCEYGSMDAKTVNAAVKRLVEAGYMRPTDERKGATKQIVVYQLAMERQPETEAFQKRKTSGSSSKDPQKRKTETSKETYPQKAKPSSERASVTPDMQTAVEEWNTLAEAFNLARVRVLDDKRKRGLRACLALHGLDGWRTALSKVRASAFLNGSQSGRGATFDFLATQPSTFLRTIEGNYDDRTPRSRNDSPGAHRRTAGDLLNDLRMARVGG